MDGEACWDDKLEDVVAAEISELKYAGNAAQFIREYLNQPNLTESENEE